MPDNQTKLKYLLTRYREAKEIAAKAYALDHYSVETKKAFALASRRSRAFYKEASKHFSWPNAYTGVEEFIKNN